MLGTTDISKIGNGTVTGSINALNSYLIDTQARRLDIAPGSAIIVDSNVWRNNVGLIATTRSLFFAIRWSSNTTMQTIVNNGDVSFGNSASDAHVFMINNLLKSTNYVSIFF